MPIGEWGGLASASGALEEPFLDEERLVHVLERRGLFTHHYRQGVETDRTALVLGDQRVEETSIHFVEAALVHAEQSQRLVRHGERHHAIRLDEREVAQDRKSVV